MSPHLSVNKEKILNCSLDSTEDQVRETRVFKSGDVLSISDEVGECLKLAENDAKKYLLNIYVVSELKQPALRHP